MLTSVRPIEHVQPGRSDPRRVEVQDSCQSYFEKVRVLALAAVLAATACSKHIEGQSSDPLVDARASAETMIRRTLSDPRTARFYNVQSFVRVGHSGVIVCGDYAEEARPDQMSSATDFVWGTTDSVASGLRTAALIGVDGFGALQLASCEDGKVDDVHNPEASSVATAAITLPMH